MRTLRAEAEFAKFLLALIDGILNDENDYLFTTVIKLKGEF